MPTITVSIQSNLERFQVDGVDYIFSSNQRHHRPSHRGSQIYMWKGVVNEGVRAGRTGVYIGEAVNLIRRLHQYRTGPQQAGNQWMRDNFLQLGEIQLYIIRLEGLLIDGLPKQIDLTSKHHRLLLEQMCLAELLAHPVAENQWVVNRNM